MLLRKSISFREMLEGLKRYKKFPLFDSTSALLNAVSWQIPVFLLATFFSPVIVGFYALGFRVLQLPMNLIGSAIAQVFFQRAAEAHKSGDLAPLVRNIVDLLLKVVMFPMVMLAVVGPDLFIVVFGEGWGEAGIYIQILSVWAIFWFLYSAMSTIYVVLEKQRFGLRFNIVNLSTRFLSLLIGGIAGNVFLALALFSLSGAVTYGIFCLVLFDMAGVTAMDVISSFIRIFAFSVPGLCVLLFIKFMAMSPLVTLIVSCMLIALYYVAIYVKDSQVHGLLSRPHA